MTNAENEIERLGKFLKCLRDNDLKISPVDNAIKLLNGAEGDWPPSDDLVCPESEGIQRAIDEIKNGRFLHDSSPEKKFADEVCVMLEKLKAQMDKGMKNLMGQKGTY